MSKFVFNESMYGRKVKFLSNDTHMDMPEFYPAVGTVGTVVEFYDNYEQRKDWKVQWPKGSTSGDDCWFCDEENVELIEEVDKQMTNEEIWEILKPKMEKNGLTSIASISRFSASDYPNGLARCEFIPVYAEKDVQKAIVLAYRSGYGRGQKGRPFVIGEKKQQSPHWEWIKPDEIVPDGTKVRYMKRAEDDDGHNPYYPKIGQECIKLNPSWWSDSDFWVQFEGSEYEYTCFNSSRDCFQKWVEDDE